MVRLSQHVQLKTLIKMSTRKTNLLIKISVVDRPHRSTCRLASSNYMHGRHDLRRRMQALLRWMSQFTSQVGYVIKLGYVRVATQIKVFNLICFNFVLRKLFRTLSDFNGALLFSPQLTYMRRALLQMIVIASIKPFYPFFI